MSAPATRRAVIFDMDGVLVDTVALSWSAYNQALAEYGIHVSNAEIARYVGRPLRSQVRALNARYGTHINAKQFEAQANAIEEPLFRNLQPKPGVTRLLEGLRDLGVPIAVGTSTPRPLAVKRLKIAGIFGYMSAVAGEGDVETHKPSPDVFLYAAKRLRVKPSRCLVFEDAPAGVAAALAAGMKCCAITNQFAGAGALSDANIIVDSLEQVSAQQILDTINSN